jgi:hypothetical protein
MHWMGADAVLRALLEDAQRDVRLWLRVAKSNEERVYVRGIAQRLAALEQTVDHCIYGLARDNGSSHWNETVRALLELLQKAKGVRGCIVGKHLIRLASQLDEKAGSKTAERITVENTAGVGRRSEVDAYIAEVLEKTGKKITRKDIWQKAGYKSRTEFERWERQDTKHPNAAAAKNFSRILQDKPHLS